MTVVDHLIRAWPYPPTPPDPRWLDAWTEALTPTKPDETIDDAFRRRHAALIATYLIEGEYE